MSDKRIARWRAMNRFEMDAQVAEYRLLTEGIKPELLAYLRGIGDACKPSNES